MNKQLEESEKRKKKQRRGKLSHLFHTQEGNNPTHCTYMREGNSLPITPEGKKEIAHPLHLHERRKQPIHYT